MPATNVSPAFLRAALCALACLTATALAQAPVVQPDATTSASVSPPAPTANEPSFMNDARAMDAMAQEVVDRAHIPGMAMAIVQDGKVLVMKGYGVTEMYGKEPVTTDTVFRLASLSKGFAATLAALLVQDGMLGWDMRVADHLPMFQLPQDTQMLTVRDILSQRAGLTRNTYDRDLEADVPFETLVQKLVEAPMACAPGACYAYQNVSFSLIGDVVFAVTGDFYTHQVEERIFHPLGMYDSSYGRDALEASPSWARPHVHGGGGWVAIRPREAYYRIPPAAGVNTSIHDMTMWLLAQMGHRPDVLSPAVLADIHTPLVPTVDQLHGAPWRRERLTDAQYATGWRIFTYAGHTLVFHGGAVQGYRTMIGFLPDKDIGLVVLWNSESAVPSGLMPMVMDRALGLPQQDWIGLDEVGRAPAAPSRRVAARDGYKPGVRSGRYKAAARRSGKTARTRKHAD
ncbi:MAG TPA: serine hydrolase domain-containing protein [Xanthomonadaceae bacterium]|jgi:beta-lactamase class C|nr:serine hydrolase domain-containing protein [Xanthomonadaceae bacterium]